MVIERKLLTEGWKAIGKAKFECMAEAVKVKDTNVIIDYLPRYKVNLYSDRCMGQPLPE